MPEYLLEIRCDEVPSRLLRPVMKQLGGRLFEDLMGRGLAPREIVTGLSHRRFALCCHGLPEHEPDREERELGPPRGEAYTEDGEPTEALTGFAERVGTTPEQLEIVKTERGEYVAHVHHQAGRPVGEVLAELMPRILSEIRWGAPKLRSGATVLAAEDWIRPLRGLVSLLDGEVQILELAGLRAGRESAGHPIHSPQPFEVSGIVDYLELLTERGIEISFEARREALRAALKERAEALGGELPDSTELLDRVALRCEIPGVVEATFEGEYLALPTEVVQTVLRECQAAFALTQDGKLLPHFLAVMDREDDPRGMVRAGQEWAAAGHLGDASFHYETDRGVALAERARRLDQLEFHPVLGHYGQKAARVRSLTAVIVRELGWQEESETAAALEAAGLLKVDLTTALGRNFPSLNGCLAGLYARDEGYIESVWGAIYDQYLPLSLDDRIPRGRVGQVVAVADRIDDLVGFFGLGQVPTGSKDPRGLRRRAQGLLRILIEAELALDLDLVAAQAALLYNEEERLLEGGAEEIVKGLQGFLGDRLRQLLGQRGYAYDEIEAALAVGGTTNLADLSLRLQALRQVRGDSGFHSLVLSAKRIFNIVKDSPEFELRAELLDEEAEKDLYADLVDVRRSVDEAAARRDYEECLRRMFDLVPSLERFFAEVLVMDEDETRRSNRMALLQSTRRMFWRVARLKEMTARLMEDEEPDAEAEVEAESEEPASEESASKESTV